MTLPLREIRYLASKYVVQPSVLNRCVRMVAGEHNIAPEQVANLIYDIDGKITKVCARSDIGHRPTNEDMHVLEHIYVDHLGGDVVMAGVFDGHGGSQVARALASELGKFLSKELNAKLTSDRPSAVSNVLVQAIVQFDENLRDRKLIAGSTLTMVLVTRNYIYSANVGDSRIVVFTPKGRLLLETKDHKPSDPDEKNRIEAAGGRVVDIFGVPRVNGNLSLSRAIGDFSQEDKPLGGQYSISNIADVLYIERTEPVFILLACDGVWDVLNTEEVVSLAIGSDADWCKNIIDLSLARNTRDNLTVMLLRA